jgi:hypothetical protein
VIQSLKNSVEEFLKAKVARWRCPNNRGQEAAMIEFMKNKSRCEWDEKNSF